MLILLILGGLCFVPMILLWIDSYKSGRGG